MASFVVAASLFVIGTSYLVQFVMEPQGNSVSNLEHLQLRARGELAMDVLLGTPGLPPTWGADATSVNGMQRLGLLESGTTIRVNADKFDALARGRYLTANNANGALDYAEAKSALGLDGFEFHLRAYPLPVENSGANYGVDGFDDFRVAYVGDVNGETFTNGAKAEASAIENLSVIFLNKTRTASTSGDVFQDDANTIRTHLLPGLGATIQQEVISAGSGTKYDFYRVNKSSYQGLVGLNATSTLSTAMALSKDGTTLGYTKSREIRAIVGGANLSGSPGSGTLANIHWWEWVDTDRGNLSYDCGDYGYLEVSGDEGQTWVKITDTTADRSQDCGTPPGTVHSASMIQGVPVVGAALTSTLCPTCVGNHNVLVAFHWVADNDNNIGYGWVVDNLRVVLPSGALALGKTFDKPQYGLLVVGSNVDHNAFTPAEVKDGIRDYVRDHGGRIVVLGGQTNVQWLDRLFDSAAGGSSGGLSSPDTTHPLLNLPNKLSYTTYVPQAPWDFTGSADGSLFSMIAGPDETHHHLSISRQGVWGSEGSVILTSYRPHEFSEDEARRFLANTVVYGRFHYLYLEVGPPIPTHEAVASVARTGLMNKYRDGTTNFTDLAFVMYMWPGASVAATQGQTAENSLAVQGFAATAGDDRVWVNWTAPLSTGTGTPLAYEVWRGSSPNNMSLADNLTYAAFNGTYYDHGANTSNGVTQWYNVTVWSTTGRGTTANVVSATPLGLPSEPQSPVGSPRVGAIEVSWTAPASAGGGNIFGYAIWVNDSVGGYVPAGEIGSGLIFTYPVSDEVDRTFKISALNGAGWGPNSSITAPVHALMPATAPSFSVSNATANRLELLWAAPADLGGGELSGYRIYRSPTGVDGTWYELAYANSAVNVTWFDANVSDNTTYHYRVRAVTNFGDGLNSTTRTGETNGVPWHPTGLIQDGIPGGGVISMSWSAPASNGGSPILRYEIFRGNPQGTETYLGQSATLSYADISAGIGSTWWYKVRAVNMAGDGPFSATVMMSG